MYPAPELSGTHRALATLITERLRLLLERRSIRFAVVGFLLIAASTFTFFPAPVQAVDFDPRWIFILPVAIAAIAAGLREGLTVALISVALIGLFAAAATGGAYGEAALVTLVAQWFALLGIVAAVLGAFAEAHYSVQSSLMQLATTDPLTKVSNIERFYHELSVLQASKTPYVVMILDLDELKTLNDQHGHQAGSMAIQTVANVLRSVVRGTDTIARYGGDEFVVILKDADRVGAQIVTNRVRTLLADQKLPQAPEALLTVSMGVAVAGEDGATSEELLSVADKAMYEDKRSRKMAV
ncbi:MAG TPA: GGDEF domain-containing protein [Actinomycetota bacterium]|nr:GGDEF domain-containing protein [Actinomycetota bacterium]